MPKEKWLVDREKYYALADIRNEIYNKVDDIQIDRDNLEKGLVNLNEELAGYERSGEQNRTSRERERIEKIKNDIEFSKKKIGFCDDITFEKEIYFVGLDKCIGYRESICNNIPLTAEEKQQMRALENQINKSAPDFISRIEGYKNIELERSAKEREITEAFKKEREQEKINAEKEYERRHKENEERRAAAQKREMEEKEAKEAEETYNNVKLDPKRLLDDKETRAIGRKFNETFNEEQKDMFRKFSDKLNAKKEREYSFVKEDRLADEKERCEGSIAKTNSRIQDFLGKNPSIEARADKFGKDFFADVLNESNNPSEVYENVEKAAADISALKELSKIHSEKKPGFFARLFNTSSNKAYKKEEEQIQKVADAMQKAGFDEKFVKSLTDPAKKDEPLAPQTIVNEFEKAYRIDEKGKSEFDSRVASEIAKNQYQLIELSKEGKDAFKEMHISDLADSDKRKIEIPELEPEKQCAPIKEGPNPAPAPQRENVQPVVGDNR